VACEEADDAWVRLWSFFADGGRNDARAVSESDRARVFGSPPACLGHLSAVIGAGERYARGVMQAWPRWAGEAGVPWQRLAAASGLLDGQTPTDANTIPAALARIAEVRGAESARAVEGLANVAARGRGAFSALSASLTGRPNLLVAALHPHPDGEPPSDSIVRNVPLLVALVFGRPIWPALGVDRPTVCRRCGGEISDPSDPSAPSAWPDRVTTTLDDHGEHARLCRRQRPGRGAKAVHDALARALARIARQAGRDAQVHGGPMLDKGVGRLAPADILVSDCRHPAGLCVDLSIGLRSVMTAEERSLRKSSKYAAYMTAHSAYGFSPFILESTGDMGEDAHTLVRRWASGAAARLLALGLPASSSHSALTTRLAHAFASRLTDAIATFFHEPL
jgi:hypothetical protein